MGYHLTRRKYSIPNNPQLIQNKDKKISFLYTIFSDLQLIGRGKDGEVYIAKPINNDKKQIVKILSFYGLKFLPITKEFASFKIISKYLYQIDILNNSFIIYPYEKLSLPNSSPLDFLDQLIMISELEIELIKNNLIYLDFSNKHHINYLIDSNNNLKIIDYTGGSFYYIDKINTKLKFNRINLITAKNRYVQSKLLIHIYYWGLGRKNYKGKIQDSYLEIFKFLEVCRKEFFGSVYFELFSYIINTDLLKIGSWENLIKIIKRIKCENKYFLMEKADIDKVIVRNNQIKVIGYQNYNISIKDKKIIPIKGNSKLWRTDKKYELILNSLNLIKELNIEINSFIDIGSNLGLYVFTACLIYGIRKCVGIDYNSEYIEKTNKIRDHLNLENCIFLVNKFEDLNEKYDCVVAVGLIHHLYHRTESYGSLEPIIKKLSDLTKKALIIEFPTEHDEKAKKWTNIPGRKKLEKYNLNNFLKCTDKYFSKVIKIGDIANTRLMFLLLK
ncbi:MAG: methyltransferase domain-containing protein [Promethearchaeota archaeon]